MTAHWRQKSNHRMRSSHRKSNVFLRRHCDVTFLSADQKRRKCTKISQKVGKCSKTHTSSCFMLNDVRKHVISWNNVILWRHPNVTYEAMANTLCSNIAYVFIRSYAKFEVRSSSRSGDIAEIVKEGNFMLSLSASWKPMQKTYQLWPLADTCVERTRYFIFFKVHRCFCCC